MDTAQTSDRRNASHSAFRAWPVTLIGALLRVFKRGAFEVLRLLQPVVLPLLGWLAIGGVGLWFLFVRIAHDDGFPTARVLLMSLGCVLGGLLYCVLLESLRPAPR